MKVNDRINDERIHQRCIELIYAQTTTASFASLFCISMLYLVYWDNINPIVLNTWSLLFLSLVGLRFYQKTHYNLKGENDNQDVWLYRLYYDLGLTGFLWGSMCAYLAIISDPEQLLLVIVIIAGLMTGSVLSYSFKIRLFALFSSLLTFPTICVLFMKEEQYMNIIAALIVAWFVFVLVAASRFKNFYLNSLSLEFQNVDLAKDLEGKNSQVNRLNENLQEKLAALSLTKNELLMEKNNVESLVNELKKLSTIDPLTGIYNRRQFNDSLSKEWSRLARDDKQISLILCDLDYFKNYNDYYGHQQGDNCLIKVAETINKIAQRGGDSAARYGGEEFAIILPDTSMVQAAQLAERARDAIISLEIPAEAAPGKMYVTMSFGVASMFPNKGNSHEEIIKQADRALYFAKSSGRNCVKEYIDGLADDDDTIIPFMK